MAAEDVRPSAGRRAVIDLVSGSLGGVANVYVGQPLDTIKVKLQTFPHLYRGATQCGLNTFKTEGKTKSSAVFLHSTFSLALLTYPRHYRPIILTFNYRLSSSSCLHFIKCITNLL